MLVGGLGVFSVAALNAGLADSLGQLLVSRGAQGVGAAMALPAAPSILTSTFSEGAARNKALGIFAATHRGLPAGVAVGRRFSISAALAASVLLHRAEGRRRSHRPTRARRHR
jgi:MFS family permease